MEFELGRTGAVARVKTIEDERHLLFLEFRNGSACTVECNKPSEFEKGDIVRIFEDEPSIELAPPELWPEDKWIGVVRQKFGHETLIESSVKLLLVPTGDIEFKVDNTVEGTDVRGIIRVISEKPIRYGDHRSVEEVDISRYRHDIGSGTESRDDFGGMNEIWERAQRLIVTPIKRAAELERLGATSTKGVLFTGLPGTGKTMLGRILANQVSANFYEISGPEIFSKWYGQSGEILRRIFEDAEKQRSIIFIDEIDSVVPNREGDTHEESQRVVGQMLTLMDGFAKSPNITVVGTTNRAEAIDPALRRPGRFDVELVFSPPERNDRVAILRAQSRRYRLGDDTPYEWLAEESIGWTPAELASIFREAALITAGEERSIITADDCKEAFELVNNQRGIRHDELRARRPA